jgi:hypothetical protein
LKNTTVTGTLGVTGASTLAALTTSGTLTSNGTTALKNTTVTGTLTVTGQVSAPNLNITGSINPSGLNNKIHFENAKKMELEGNSFAFSTRYQHNDKGDLSSISVNQNTLASLIYDLIYPVGSIQLVSGSVTFAPLVGTWIEIHDLVLSATAQITAGSAKQYLRQS